jgi:hypothetical protein
MIFGYHWSELLHQVATIIIDVTLVIAGASKTLSEVRDYTVGYT